MSRILIIEDDFYVRNLYKTAFENAGYTVEEAASGENGLDRVMKTPEAFAFIILDLMLPKIPGLQVLAQLRNLTQVPVYILTNVGDELSLQEAIRQGATAYFLKVDFSPKQLIQAIEKKQEEVSKS